MKDSTLPRHSPYRGEKGAATGAGLRRLTFLVGETEYWPSKSISFSLSRLSPALLSSRTRDRAFFVHASPDPAPPLPRCGPASAIPALSVYPSSPVRRSGGPGYRRQVGCLFCYRLFRLLKKKKTNRQENDVLRKGCRRRYDGGKEGPGMIMEKITTSTRPRTRHRFVPLRCRCCCCCCRGRSTWCAWSFCRNVVVKLSVEVPNAYNKYKKMDKKNRKCEKKCVSYQC